MRSSVIWSLMNVISSGGPVICFGHAEQESDTNKESQRRGEGKKERGKAEETYPMSIHPNDLAARFKAEIEFKRRQHDDTLDFMMHDAHERRAQWLGGVVDMIERDQPEFKRMPGLLEVLGWAATEAPENIRDALFWVCAANYKDLRDFLQHQTTVVDEERVGFFLNRQLPRLCDAFLRGLSADPSVDAFERGLRADYVATVGVHLPLDAPKALPST